LKCFLPFGLRLVSDVDAPFLSPEEIGTNGDESVRRIPIADLAQVLIDAEYFLEDDNAGAVTAGG
jgi:hypothetical protein